MRNLVQELRDQGYKVRVTHYRRYIDWGNKIKSLSNMDQLFLKKIDFIAADIVELANYESPDLKLALPKGGTTVVNVITKHGRVYTADSVCSEKDQFNKKLGTKIATSRVMVKMNNDNSL